MTSRSPQHRRHGFTLLELMIVVGILGILATIAIPNFVRYMLRSRQAEALLLLGSLKSHQHSFHATYDCFAPTERMPVAVPNPSKNPWTSVATGFANPCSGARLSFEDLAMRPSANGTYFQYQCEATIKLVTGPTDELTCSAYGDLDGDSNFYELVYCTDLDGDGAGLVSSYGTPCTFPGEMTRFSIDLY